ncbi:L-glutamate gamma-semialdehyde dehydrogenase [Ravibacter arvi]|uniref:L-glutamate gamma-semialdehyde dehydrogenase n=1 Tax=Ravibacter arvi TaxID=2051041 RepID=A0ABP8MAL0_9BACT
MTTHAFFKAPIPVNEPVRSYSPGSADRANLKRALAEARESVTEIPQYIGSEQVFSGVRENVTMPHDHRHVLAHYHIGTEEDVRKAIDAALAKSSSWAAMSWEHRAAIFLKAADLIAGPYRYKLNAATMQGQSKNAYQAEIDSACELIDFLRFNVAFMTQIYADQPSSSPGCWNRMVYRPLEGFVFALTPFNFTAIAGNLPAAPALMGNVVVWKPAFSQLYAANLIMQIFREAGLPDGVINMILVDGPDAGKVIFEHESFAGLHFTGSTAVFREIWKTIGNNLPKYRSFPRIVGETGGKDFVLVHSSADPLPVAAALVRGAFEYQGQKCSAASRAYIPSDRWPDIRKEIVAMLKEVKMGPVEDFRNFVNAVIDERAFDKIAGYLSQAKEDGLEVLWGGNADKSTGYFVEPTVLVTKDPYYRTMVEEIFGPVLTVFVFEPSDFEQVISMVDRTSPYALTGALFCNDREVVAHAADRLSNAAGNFYINDKPTGAVVGQQPFGGARASGTNDKAGAMQNLLRWVSSRTIKETFVSPVDFRYPFMQES